MSNEIIQATHADFYVYAHRRATTGEIFYIGKGQGRRAFDSTGRNRHWHFVVKKHGFTVEIVQDGLQEFAAFELECDLIALYGRKDCGLGELVNYTDGGEGSAGTIQSEETRLKKRNMRIGKTWTDEVKQKIAETNKRTKSSSEYKKRASEMRMGEKHPMFGKKASDEARANMSKAHTGRPNPKAVAAMMFSNIEAKKPVLCVETGAVFASAPDAARFLKANGVKISSHTSIAASCSGRNQRAFGSEWRFVCKDMVNEDFRSLTLELAKQSADAKVRKVICVESGQVFGAVTEAVNFIKSTGNGKASTSSISAACNGRQRIAYGFQWRYAD